MCRIDCPGPPTARHRSDTVFVWRIKSGGIPTPGFLTDITRFETTEMWIWTRGRKQWRIQEFQKGDAEQRVWGGSPPARSLGGALVGVWGEALKSYGHYATFTTHNKRKLQYGDIYNTTKTGRT